MANERRNDIGAWEKRAVSIILTVLLGWATTCLVDMQGDMKVMTTEIGHKTIIDGEQTEAIKCLKGVQEELEKQQIRISGEINSERQKTLFLEKRVEDISLTMKEHHPTTTIATGLRSTPKT